MTEWKTILEIVNNFKTGFDIIASLSRLGESRVEKLRLVHKV